MPLFGDAKREYQRLWIKKRRDDWIDSQGGKCVRCGSSEKLEVDHVDRTTKSMNPSNIWSLSQEKREMELAKCQVLCAECHLEKSISESKYPHGTYARYNSGCRCEDCTKTVAPYWREKRKKNNPR